MSWIFQPLLPASAQLQVGLVFADIRQAIINGLDSAQSEGTGWDAEVKAKIPVTDVVRTSNTVVTITLSAAAAYDITAQETIEATIPASALVGAAPIVATPTFTVDEVMAEQYYGTASISSNGLIEEKIQKGGIGYIWAQAAGIVLSVGVAGMLAAGSIFGGGSLNVAAQKAVSAGVVVSGAGSVIAEGHLEGISLVSITGNGSIIADGLKTGRETVSISEDGTIQGIGIKQAVGDSTLTGSGSLVVLGIPGGMEEYFGSAIIPGGGEVLGIGEKIGEGIVLISGNGSLSASGTLGYPEEYSGSAIISGNGLLYIIGINSENIRQGSAFISGNGSIVISSRTKINRKQPILRRSIPISEYSTIMASQGETLSGSLISKKETQISIPIMVSSGGKSLESFIFIKVDLPLGEMIAKKDEEE